MPVPVVPGRVVDPVPVDPAGRLNELPVPVVPVPVVPVVPVVPGRGGVTPGRAVEPVVPVVPVVPNGRAAVEPGVVVPGVVGRAADPAVVPAPVCICFGFWKVNPPAAAPLDAAAVPPACAFSSAARSTSGAPGRFN